MVELSAIFGGDQLTRERLDGCIPLRQLAPTPEERFDHIKPIVCEFWHVKQDMLEVRTHAKIYSLFKIHR